MKCENRVLPLVKPAARLEEVMCAPPWSPAADPPKNSVGRIMSKALPFTEHSLARAIRAIEKAGKHAIGVKPDGTLIIGDKPIDPASLVPVELQNDPTSKWEDQGA